MAKERLLKRIRNWSLAGDTNLGDPEFGSYVESLLDDLSKIYNTRHGTVMLDPKFGIPDFTSLMNNMSPPEVAKLTQSFTSVTNQYEQRLKSLDIRHEVREEDRGLIRFVVKSKLEFRKQLAPFTFDILLQGDGSIALELPA